MTDILTYKSELTHEVAAAASALGQFTEDAFFDTMTAQMIEAGELEQAERVHFSRKGLQADGYGGNPVDNGQTLTLLLLDRDASDEVQSLTATELESLFKRGLAFVDAVLAHKVIDDLDITSPAFDLCDLIRTYWHTLGKIRLCVISNRRLSKRIDGLRSGDLRGIPVVRSVWDLERAFQFATTRAEREDLLVDLEGEFGGPMPVLPAHLDGAGYEAYLGVMPAVQLAAIYDRWGTRLLEQNVRVFLQARGAVNKGIKNTIENAPDMFFAYNNGIAATAESVETRHGSLGTLVTAIRNLQIVNGGQTTASLHAAAVRKEAGLSQVRVQVKLSVIPPERALEIVPRISEYANSQNKISAADFFSNHPFHVRMQDMSRRIVAPAAEGAIVGSKWFYERARGQYNDEKARLTGAAKRVFERDFPKSQVTTKTELAKYVNSWGMLPHIVSRGAQKNFAAFAADISSAWEKNRDLFNEVYFQHAMAQAIGFKHLERLVSSQEWYSGGYRANIVAYSCAKLAHDANRTRRAINFGRIWREQRIPEEMGEAMAIVAKVIYEELLAPPAGNQNVTEWAKQAGLWDRIAARRIDWPDAWEESLLPAADVLKEMGAAVKEQKILNGIEAQTAVVNAGAAFWRKTREWGESRKLLGIEETRFLKVAEHIPAKLPSDLQSEVILAALKRLQGEGFAAELRHEST